MAKKPEDKRVASNCMKEAANRYSNFMDDAAQALPDKCGVKMDFPVSRHIDCDGLPLMEIGAVNVRVGVVGLSNLVVTTMMVELPELFNLN
ncbi:unnamed protein product [Ilex paraguariensis]|uniref:Lipid transfer protein n=1 Tax=Ilex paraguariensis TaxID=185542 RepID=A0ABC8SF45_9AQUA